MGIKSATKKELIDRGVPSTHARALALDRTTDQVKELSVEQITEILGVKTGVADELWSMIHGRPHPVAVRTRFIPALEKTLRAVNEEVLNATNDSRKIDLMPLMAKHTDAPISSFSGSYENNDEACLDALNLLAMECNLGPAAAASLIFHLIDGTTMVITDIDFHRTCLATAAREMKDAGYISGEEAEILADHSQMLPAKESPIKRGDKVVRSRQGLRPRKSYAFRRNSCSGRSSNPQDDYRWPTSLFDQTGVVTYSWSHDGLFDVTFDCGTRVKIHRKHMVKVISSDRIDEMGWPY